MTKPKNISLLFAALPLGCALIACSKTEPPQPAASAPLALSAAPAPSVVPVAASAPPAAPVPPVTAQPEPLAAPAASTDIDNPTPLPALAIKGSGLKQKLSYYYAFNAGAGTVKVTATAKNAPSGMTQALGFGLYDAKANKLCSESSGNANSDKTVVLNCQVDKAQALLLRLDLSEETIDYSVALEGPLTLPAPQAAGAAATPIAGAGSTDIDAPTRLTGNRIKGEGIKKPVSYYYAFNAGPGDLTVTADARNVSAAFTDALLVGVYSLRSEKLCQHSLGNTTLDKRGIVTCKFDKRQPVILRLDLSAETVDYRVKFDGPYDFDDFMPPKKLIIALDSAVLFDTGKAVLKPEARQTLHEAAERVKKFTDAPVTISGHTDNVGNDANNQALSTSRAAAVQAYFVNQEGVPAGRLTVKGYGKSQPIFDNATEDGRARNRRVDVSINQKEN